MVPDRQEAGEKVSWTSGLVFGKGVVSCPISEQLFYYLLSAGNALPVVCIY